MSFRRGGAGKRRDAIEPAMIQALNAIGVRTWQINGRALPDLLCLHRGRWVPLGVKSGNKARLTAAERAEPPSWAMVHSVAESLAIFGVHGVNAGRSLNDKTASAVAGTNPAGLHQSEKRKTA